MTDRTETSAPASKYTYNPQWSEAHLQFMYLTLLDDYTKLINMYEYCENHNFSLQKENGNLSADLKHALESYMNCYKAHRKLDNKLEPITFAELNAPPTVIPTGTIAKNDV